MTDTQSYIVDIFENLFHKHYGARAVPVYYVGSVVSVSGGSCSVKIGDETIVLPRRAGLSVTANDTVWVCCPTGDLSDGFVDLVRP